MNRAQRRAQERADKRNFTRNSVRVTNEELHRWKENNSNDVSMFATDVLMTSFALTLNELYGFEWEDISKCLENIDKYMGMVNRGECTVDDIREELKERTGVLVKSAD